MKGIESLRITTGMMGFTGVVDSYNQTFVVSAKKSMFATVEQNRKLEEGLLNVYKAYLEEVATENDGRY